MYLSDFQFPPQKPQKEPSEDKGLPQPPSVSRVRALYDFRPTESNELGFSCGDIINVIDNVYKDWWKGELRGKTGIFPEKITEPSPVDIAKELEMEVNVFSQGKNIERLLELLESFDAQKDSVTTNEDIQGLFVNITATPKPVHPGYVTPQGYVAPNSTYIGGGYPNSSQQIYPAPNQVDSTNPFNQHTDQQQNVYQAQQYYSMGQQNGYPPNQQSQYGSQAPQQPYQQHQYMNPQDPTQQYHQMPQQQQYMNPQDPTQQMPQHQQYMNPQDPTQVPQQQHYMSPQDPAQQIPQQQQPYMNPQDPTQQIPQQQQPYMNPQDPTQQIPQQYMNPQDPTQQIPQQYMNPQNPTTQMPPHMPQQAQYNHNI
ncbi:20025_t:CDS:2 [Racocetra fulgida]|uniref:20025_t:CDS:1 n=1 Tax=Racocetra fulgida TaxID=60492 RepID=A0A9N9FDI4_9GLOM|nr:20025_t:CDS:2 [Racocetra fulgida]